ncbi:hypothetical protein PORCAN_354 [Porphyromonas crevioricanis JCM 13913]|nr:hypothetical protein PORCAN_354 [Porphyromonas crevioricanis JCM 13913]
MGIFLFLIRHRMNSFRLSEGSKNGQKSIVLGIEVCSLFPC